MQTQQTPISHPILYTQHVKKQHNDARKGISVISVGNNISSVVCNLIHQFDKCEISTNEYELPLPTTPRDKPITMIEENIKIVCRDKYGYGK